MRNFPEIVNILIRSGADVDALDMVGRSPIFLAVKKTNVECTKVGILFLFAYSILNLNNFFFCIDSFKKFCNSKFKILREKDATILYRGFRMQSTP